MELLTKLEKLVLGWVKGLPHLPAPAQKWLAANVWWIVLVGAILSAIAVLFAIGGIFTILSLIGTVAATYYATTTFSTWAIITGLVSLVFLVAQGLLLAFAINPLKAQQKKGWVLLFASWLVNIVAVVVNALLTLNPFGFITGIIFGAVGIAISGYFILEIHAQFAHVSKSAGVKKAKK